MCGRFVVKSKAEEIMEAFGIDELLCDITANYNTAPTQQVYVILDEDERRYLTSMRWGLIPSWAKDLKFGAKAINARAETLAQKASFRSAFRHRRCLVVADGYYEWIKEGKSRTPMYIHAPDDRPLTFAGLWERWCPEDVGQEGDDIDSCTIITTEANDALHHIHHRMPVLLDPSQHAEWMDHTSCDIPKLQGLLVPCQDEELVAYEVSSRVGNVRNNDPENLEPAEPAEPPAQGSLFEF